MRSEMHVFTVAASWSDGMHGRGHVSSRGLDADVSMPAAFGGPGHGTNPEELLLGAAASCYLITLAAICQRRELPVVSVVLRSEVETTAPPALRVVSIVHRPTLAVAGHPTEAIRAAVLEAAKQAEQFCMVSGAIRGNVAVSVEADLVDA